MAPRRLKLPPPAVKTDPEVAEALIIKIDLDVPKEGDFPGYIVEEKVMDLPKPQRKIALRFSAMEQYSDWQTEKLAELWSYARQIDANAAAAKLEIAKTKAERTKKEKRAALLKWIGATFGAGIIAGSAKALLDWLVK